MKLLTLGGGRLESKIGLPLGNYLSQCLANFYLTYFDHWLKEKLRVKYMFRYCDDICILSDNKPYLHDLLIKIKNYLWINLNLEVKSNYQVFPISRGIDFVGYVVKVNNGKVYVQLRKRIKKRFAKMMKRNKNYKSITSYLGWIKYCDGNHLENKLLCR